jgi:aspartate beta-hydroxylase
MVMRPEFVEHLRKQYEALICDLLGERLTEPAYQLADIAVAQGLWPQRMHRPITLHATTKEQAFFDPAEFWFTEHLREQWPAIRAELDTVEDPAASGFATAGLDGSSVRGGKWRQLMLWDRGRRFDQACSLFPVTAEAVSAIPEVTEFGNGFVMLSWLQPGTWIAPHCGPTNSKARTHFCIRTDEQARMRVGEETRGWQDGESFTFDDSFEHEVWHEGEQARIVLIIDTPNPNLVDPDAVLKHDQSTWDDEIHTFMSSMRLSRLDRDGGAVSATFDAPMLEFIESYMDTRELASVELRGGAISATKATGGSR